MDATNTFDPEEIASGAAEDTAVWAAAVATRHAAISMKRVSVLIYVFSVLVDYFFFHVLGAGFRSALFSSNGIGFVHRVREYDRVVLKVHHLYAG
jgi:hypothetical protein